MSVLHVCALPYLHTLYANVSIFQSPCLITVSGTLQHCQDGYGEVQNKHGSPHIGNSFTLIKI